MVNGMIRQEAVCASLRRLPRRPAGPSRSGGPSSCRWPHWGTALVVRLFWAAGSSSLDAITATGPAAPADVLVVVVGALGVAVAGWLGLTVLLSALAALPGALGRVATALAGRLAPAAVRRGVALALGTAFTAAGGAPAVDGSATPRPGPTVTEPPSASAPDPGFSVTTETLSERRPAASLGPLGPAPRTTERATERATRPAAATPQIRVERGDSLWHIAARHLGPDATPGQIAREWRRWYAANRAVVGAEPDLIRVGQVLSAPPAPTPGATP